MYSYLDPINLNNWGFFDNYVERKDAVNKKFVRNSFRLIALAKAEAGRVDPTVQALFQNSPFVYK